MADEDRCTKVGVAAAQLRKTLRWRMAGESSHCFLALAALHARLLPLFGQ
jgi:hypothetical protein